MALISSSIPNFWNGVSQQPDDLRATSQCAAQENVYATLANGTGKRPPTTHVAFVTPSGPLNADAKVHFAIRDETERYVMMVEPSGTLTIRDFAGNAMTVIDASGGMAAYLATSNPRADLVMRTVSDTTFVVNRTRTCAMDATLSAGTLTGTVQAFANLPASPTVGNIYKISGSESNAWAAYYVRWTGTVWVETIAPGIVYKFNPTTMPWTITRTAPNTFTLAPIPWIDRLVGDLTTSPNPSFIGKKIKTVRLFRNRLVFVAGESYQMSRVNDFYNFFRETVRTVSDSDPIDSPVYGAAPSDLFEAEEFAEGLMLFSETAQFNLPVTDVLSPKTARAPMVTSYACSPLAAPVNLGNSVVFAAARDAYTQVREVRIRPTSGKPDAEDITAHVPNYIPGNVFQIESVTQENMAVVLSLNERNAAYIYKHFWRDEQQRVQSSWSRWTFGTGDTIMGVKAIRNVLYLVINHTGQRTTLEAINLQPALKDSGMGYLVHLDRRITLTGTYNSGNDTTTWTAPYTDPSVDTYQVVLGSDFGVRRGTVLNGTWNGTSFSALGDWTAGPVYLGRTYSWVVGLSKLLPRDQEGVALANANTILRNILFTVAGTGAFTVTMQKSGRTDAVYNWTALTVGVSSLGNPALYTGKTQRFTVGARPAECDITLSNASHMPSTLLSADWEGTVHQRSLRR